MKYAILPTLFLLLCFPYWVLAQSVQQAGTTDNDVLIPNGDLVIAGTLTLPEGDPSLVPLVILISGSGAQARDSEVFGFPVFARLADQLRANGIASFRFDDRQTGLSTGSFADATLDRLVADVGVVVDYFAVFSEQKFAEIILLGHSQGGIVAGRLAALDTRIKRVILLASTGMNLRHVLRQQVSDAYALSAVPTELVEAEILQREEIMYAVVDNTDVDAAVLAYASAYQQLLESLPDSLREQISDVDAFAANQAVQLVNAFSEPQTQSLLFHNPVIDLEVLAKPVLMIFGGKDTQVIEAQNRPLMEEALQRAGSNFKSVIFAQANHLFQLASNGQVAEYAVLDKQLVSGLTESIAQWIHSPVADAQPFAQTCERVTVFALAPDSPLSTHC